MCKCKECSIKEMELLPEFEGIFENEFEMEIDPEFALGDFIDTAAKVISPAVGAAQKIVSPFYNWVAGGSAVSDNQKFSNNKSPTVADLGPQGGMQKGLGTVIGSFFERSRVQNFIKQGIRNENALTNLLFFNRHPELGYKPLHKSMPDFSILSKEWLTVRNNIVRPVLANNKNLETFYPEMEFEVDSPTPVMSMVDPKKVSCLNSPYSEAIFKKIGTTDPVGAIEAICQRAVQMLTNTINELTRIKARIAAGDKIDYTLISKNLAFGLRFKLRMEVAKKDAWLGKGTRNAGLIIRWLTNIRNRIASRDLWYTCLEPEGGACAPESWSCAYYNTFRVYLCQRFWTPSPGVNAIRHFDYQVQSLIYVVSHMYYNTKSSGMGPGAAECLSQFIADANNSPIDPLEVGNCSEANPHVIIDAKYGNP